MNNNSRKARFGIIGAGLLASAITVGIAAPSQAAEPVNTNTGTSVSQEAQPATIFTKTVKLDFNNQTSGDAVFSWTQQSSGTSHKQTVAAGGSYSITAKSLAGNDVQGRFNLSDGTSISYDVYNPEFGKASITIDGVKYTMSDYSDPIDITINGHKVHVDLTDGTYKQFEVTIS